MYDGLFRVGIPVDGAPLASIALQNDKGTHGPRLEQILLRSEPPEPRHRRHREGKTTVRHFYDGPVRLLVVGKPPRDRRHWGSPPDHERRVGRLRKGRPDGRHRVQPQVSPHVGVGHVGPAQDARRVDGPRGHDHGLLLRSNQGPVRQFDPGGAARRVIAYHLQDLGGRQDLGAVVDARLPKIRRPHGLLVRVGVPIRDPERLFRVVPAVQQVLRRDVHGYFQSGASFEQSTVRRRMLHLIRLDSDSDAHRVQGLVEFRRYSTQHWPAEVQFRRPFALDRLGSSQ
mmetsp:Transcript_15450/g.50546  ORF Transcript_15450/g.50546 Transcript_15450/m.50546 type:complete len:285 (+) Transcript_15450:1479-2333(+)